MRVVDDTQFDLPSEVLGDQGAKQLQAESVLQRPPESFDQGGRSLLPDGSEALLHVEAPQAKAEHLGRETASLVRGEAGRATMTFRRP